MLGFTPPALPSELEAVERVERFIPGLNGAPDVRVLHYSMPKMTASPRPAILHIHGGGFVIGAPDFSDQSNRQLVLSADCVVVSVDYRLAPETRFPGAMLDCYAVLKWMSENAAELGIDGQGIAVVGESAGGGHAVALALHARDNGGPDICQLVLDAPMLDDRTGSISVSHDYCGEFVWTAENNRFGWRALLGTEPGGANVPDAAVPLRRKDLSRLPPTCITVGALDLFLEENLEFIRRLSRTGVPTELHVIPGAYHGFGNILDAPQSRALLFTKVDALMRAWKVDGCSCAIAR